MKIITVETKSEDMLRVSSANGQIAGIIILKRISGLETD
jgi:hypothetical protein